MTIGTGDRKTWDAIIVGSGMAGAMCAHTLARAGMSVLVLESGPREPDPSKNSRPGRWPGPILLAQSEDKPARQKAAILGHGAGGSTRLYGAALQRFRPSDFGSETPETGTGKGHLSSSWPIGFSELKPYYERAESLLGVRGGCDPLDVDCTLSADGLPPVSPRDAAIAEQLLANGLHPYRLPIGIKYLPGCSECQGVGCSRGCKSSSWASLLGPLVENGSVAVKFNAHVTRLEPAGSGTTDVLCGAGGQGRRENGRMVILAAGALSTPGLLARSQSIFQKGVPGLLGRGLMFHATDLFSVSVGRGLSASGPKKTIGFRDFYAMEHGEGGEVQSLGFDISPGLIAQHLKDQLDVLGLRGLGPLKELVRLPARVVALRLNGQPVFATILQDRPYLENRVDLAATGTDPYQPIRIVYRIHQELSERWQEMRSRVRGAFLPGKVTFLSTAVSPNLGHPCGTARMGHDAATSVTDPSGRVHGAIGEIYIADASLFPSSGGTNPALTVAANALRVCEGIVRRQPVQ